MRKPPNDPALGSPPARPGQGGGAFSDRNQEEAPHGAPGPRPSPGSDPERTCILTRRKGSKDALIRLALGPDGAVAPDVRARAPGRGAWIGATYAELDAANCKGKLRGALQRAFKTKDIDSPRRPRRPHGRCAAQGDARPPRHGSAVRQPHHGVRPHRNGGAFGQGAPPPPRLRRRRGRQRRKLDQAWRVGGGEAQGMIFPEGRTILSMALGRENVVHVALTDPAAAARVRHALGRWRAFTGPDRGLEGGEPALSDRLG